jgi:hypothetical protein
VGRRRHAAKVWPAGERYSVDYGSAKMMTIAELLSICHEVGECMPDATATYCLPCSAYEMTPPPIG